MRANAAPPPKLCACAVSKAHQYLPMYACRRYWWMLTLSGDKD